MSNTDKLREIAHKYGGAIITGYGQSSASGSTEMFTAEEQCLSDLTALLEQHKEMMMPKIINDFLDFALPIYWGENEYTNFEQIAELYLKNVKK